MRHWKWQAAVGAALAAAVVVGTIGPARPADHRDAPAINEDSRADLNDVYAFVNPNNGNVVLAMTVNPFVVPGALGVAFSPGVLYQFKIDNTGDAREDLVIDATFTEVPNQAFAVTLPHAVVSSDLIPRRAGLGVGRVVPTPPAVVTGPANGTVVGASGIRVFAGLTDDPFFFDGVFVLRLLGNLPGGPVARAPGIDLFQGLNVSTLAVEVPPTLLRGSTGNVIRIWGATLRNGQQGDRMGLPAINTVLIPGSKKDAFNRAAPVQDRPLFRADALARLIQINSDATYSAQVVDLLLPDLLTLDMTNTDGFGSLNGRRPQDDVIDVVLTVASNSAVTSDGVAANDVPFLTDFPFFAPPHQPSEPIPPRN
jgi:hypothetical protein